jgi:hypothetical protein
MIDEGFAGFCAFLRRLPADIAVFTAIVYHRIRRSAQLQQMATAKKVAKLYFRFSTQIRIFEISLHR